MIRVTRNIICDILKVNFRAENLILLLHVIEFIFHLHTEQM